MMRRALFPGTFDPFTIGHEDIVRRALTFMDEVIIGIGINDQKQTCSHAEERVNVIRQYYAHEKRIKVETFSELTTDFAKRMEAGFIIRGVRNVKDYEYEMNMADINRQLSGIETILLFSKPELAAISSSVVRELMKYGKDVSQFLPPKITSEK